MLVAITFKACTAVVAMDTAELTAALATWLMRGGDGRELTRELDLRPDSQAAISHTSAAAGKMSRRIADNISDIARAGSYLIRPGRGLRKPE
jgi:hypothetical protein